MTIDLTNLKALATAAAANQYDAVALNDYGTALPPATVLGLIAEIERHRQVNAEGCKPDSSILLSSAPCAGAAPRRSLDKVEGCKPDLNTRPFKREDRYIVIKRSDLEKVPVGYHSSLVVPMFSLLSHLPRREFLVIESDWPEFEQTWAAVEARVTGKPAEQHQGEPSAITAPAGVPISNIREAMEISAAQHRTAEFQIGEAHLRVTYHGIKWYHDRRQCNRWEPLGIEEFDEILHQALGRRA